MNTKKFLAILLVICCFATLLSSCGITISDLKETDDSQKNEANTDEEDKIQVTETNTDGHIVIPENNYEDYFNTEDVTDTTTTTTTETKIETEATIDTELEETNKTTNIPETNDIIETENTSKTEDIAESNDITEKDSTSDSIDTNESSDIQTNDQESQDVTVETSVDNNNTTNSTDEEPSNTTTTETPSTDKHSDTTSSTDKETTSSTTQKDTDSKPSDTKPNTTESTNAPETETKPSNSPSGINAGKFEGSTTQADFTVTYISGTKNAYTYDDTTKVLTFTALSEDSVYAISGKLNGNIIIDAGENFKLDLELTGFSLRSSSTNPIFIKSGNEVKITAKKDTQNYIYDERPEVDTTQTDVYGGAIHALCDLKIRGRGELFVQSAKNNGIQTKKDLQVKNLSLIVECIDNALKGNDSVTIENCATLLVAKGGDAIKTEETNLSSSTNKQRGTVSILGGSHNIYAANDGINASFDVIIDNGTYLDDATQKTHTVATIINIYTDEYSSYESEHTQTVKPSTEKLYVCYPSSSYKYSIKFMSNDTTKFEWVNGTFDKSIPGSRGTTYSVYSFEKKSEYTKMQLYIYSSNQEQQNETNYYSKTDVITIKSGCDSYKYSSSKRTWSWTTYDQLAQSGGGGMGGPGGPGGEGNSAKLAYSAKGIKASNAVTINAGTITIKAPDDAIHADNTTTLESGAKPTGNVNINGGTITVTTKDDGLHADGAMTISGGTITVLSSYEGIEGNTIKISGGNVSVTSSDDGLNSCTTSGAGITIAGGQVYVYAGGDGIDSNSRTSYGAIVFSGGKTVIISTSNGNSAIDSDGGYKYSGGQVLAVMPQGGMSSESTHCSNFSSIGKKQNISLSANAYATVKVNGSAVLSVKMPKALSALAIYLGSNSATVSSASSSAGTADTNGVWWAN